MATIRYSTLEKKARFFEVSNYRLKRENTPESPRKLLDCLALCKGV